MHFTLLQIFSCECEYNLRLFFIYTAYANLLGFKKVEPLSTVAVVLTNPLIIISVDGM